MTVQIGFVGCGNRAVREMMDLVRIPEANIAAVCDVTEELATSALDKLNSRHEGQPVTAPAFADTKKMLESVHLDAVYVSLPPFAHGAIEHAIIDASKAIFVEKPLAVDMPVAREIDAHIREKGVLGVVGYQWRYAEPMEKARQLLHGVPVGLLIAIRLGGLPSNPWWRVQSKSGGMLIEQHTHSVDVLRYLAGDATTVYAAANRALLTDVPDMTIDDVNAVTVTFASGAVGSIVNSCAVAGPQMPNLSNYVHVVAKDLVLGVSAGSITIMRPGQEREEIKVEHDESNYRLNDAFVRAVSTGDRSLVRSSYSDALRTHAITVGAVESAREHRPIDLQALLQG